jgi:TolB protein
MRLIAALSVASCHHTAGSDALDAAVTGHRCVDDVVSSRNDLSHVRGGVIAYQLRDAQGHLQIHTSNPDGTQDKQLTADGDNGLPAWSRDGKRIAFMASRATGPYIGVMNADGSDQRLFAMGGQAPDWSPDGRLIAFSAGSQIWTMMPDGNAITPLTSSPTYKARPTWSPDGKRMVFMQLDNPSNPDDPQPQIGIMNADGSNEHLLTTMDRTNVCIESDGTTRVLETARDANAPQWSPGDDRITFWSGIETKYGQVWSIHADGTGSTQLSAETHHSNNDDPSWSPDGTKILFGTGRSHVNELWGMDADGSNPMRLWPQDAGPFPGRAAWQPMP